MQVVVCRTGSIAPERVHDVSKRRIASRRLDEGLHPCLDEGLHPWLSLKWRDYEGATVTLVRGVGIPRVALWHDSESSRRNTQ
eukprot:6018135-Pyramimonas_sp.AAC.1